ncbi:intein-containing DNA gyrase subunit A [Staphylococcus phage Machias]|nr:intein-containing DNA gyrase subunit A [Staphylococcus phage Machias]
MAEIFKKDLKEVVHDNMMIYFNEINTNRQIPDVRDGLKPIQRKILYIMYKNGYRSDKKFAKSARIAGDTTILHPHSNDGIYDSAVNMITPFSMNQPLIEGHGAFGSITGASAAASRYCLTGNHIVELSEGELRRIKDIVPNTDLDTTHSIDKVVKDFRRKSVKASKFFNSGKHKVMELETESGKNIKATLNHPLLTVIKHSTKGLDFKWKTMDEIKEGDYLINRTMIKNDLKDFRSKNLNENEKESFRKWGELLSQKYFKDTLDPEYGILMKSIETEKILPDKILEACLGYKREFLMELFRQDSEIVDNIGLIIESYSKKFMQEISVLLSQFGIYSVINEFSTDTFRLQIQDIHSLKNLVNHLIKDDELYNDKIESIINMYRDDKPNKYQIIPFLSEVLDERKMTNYFYPELFNTRKNFLNNFNLLEEEYGIEILDNDHLLLFISKYLDNNTYFDKVKSIESLDEEETVYSIRVDTEDHSFMAEGFIHHNTEMRLNKFSERNLLDNINDNAVNMVKNFDGSMLEPLVLPAKLPYILVNGSFGIGGGGHRSDLPPHDINDVVNITIDRLKNPNKQLKTLIKDNNFRPQFPYGGEAYVDDLEKYYRTGKGSMLLRSVIEKDESKSTLTITEIPYNVTLERMIEAIKEAYKEERLDGLKNISDGSQKGNVNLILQYTKSTDLDLALNQLYKIKTVTSRVNFDIKLVDNNKLIETNLLNILDRWIEFRQSTVKRIKSFKIKDLRSRIHIIEGLLVVLDSKNIDQLIKIVKSGKGKEDIIDTVSKKFNISHAQAAYVADMKLYTINNLEVNKLIEEKNEKEEIVNSEMEYMKDVNKLKNLIVEELKEIKKDKNTLKRARITKYSNLDFKSDNKDLLVKDEEFMVIITKHGKIKKVKAEVSKPQKRNGKGISIGKLSDGDVPLNIFNANSKDNLFLVTDQGKLFYDKVYEFPEIKSLNNFGKDITRFTKKENIVKAFTLTDEELKDPDTAFVVTTELNKIKMVMVEEISRSGVILIKLNEDDKVVNVHNVHSKKPFNLVAISEKGNMIRFSHELVPVQKRTTIGSAIFSNTTINKNNKVASTVIDSGQDKVLIVTHKSLAKKVEIDEIPVKSRSIKGVIAAKFKDDKDSVMYISMIDNEEEDNMLLVTENKTINVPLSEINTYKRTTFGNPLMKLNDSEYCIDASIIKTN